MAKTVTGILTLALGFAGLAHADGEMTEFSAEVVQKTPNQPAVEWKIHAGAVSGKTVIRSESEQNGEQWAQLTFPEERRQVLMNVTEKTYMERRLPAPPGQGPKDADGKAETGGNTPCAGNPRTRCEKLGTEPVHGREAVKWQILQFGRGQPARWLVWVDQERDFPVRRISPAGTYMERRLAEEGAQVAGRGTEKWETLFSQPNGRTFQSVRWYDPELDMTVKEKREGGFVREFTTIRVEEQADKLFRIPDEFSRASGGPGHHRRPAHSSNAVHQGRQTEAGAPTAGPAPSATKRGQ